MAKRKHTVSQAARAADRARKRYRRQAERYMGKAEKARGAERERYRAAAKSAVEKAIATYSSKSKVQGRVAGLARELGVETRASDYSESFRSLAILESPRSLFGNETANQTARAALSGVAGQRFYAGLSEVWLGQPDREQAVIDFFGADNLLQVLSLAEKIAPQLYAPQEDATRAYDAVTTALAEYVAERQ